MNKIKELLVGFELTFNKRVQTTEGLNTTITQLVFRKMVKPYEYIGGTIVHSSLSNKTTILSTVTIDTKVIEEFNKLF